MKKFLIIALLAIISFTSQTELSAKDEHHKYVESFVESMVPISPQWDNAKLQKSIEVYNAYNYNTGCLFRLFNGKEQVGFILYSYDDGIVKATFEGEDNFLKNETEMYIALDGSYVYKNQLEEHNQKYKEINNEYFGSAIGYKVSYLLRRSDGTVASAPTDDFIIDFSKGVPVISNNLTSYDYLTQQGTYINNVPDYLNELVSSGCTPTATAMLIAYLDNEWRDSLTSYDTGDYDMIAEDNLFGFYRPTEVKNLINSLASYMGTVKPYYHNGTTIKEFAWGLTNFMQNTSYSEYAGYYSPIIPRENGIIIQGVVNEYLDYLQLIEKNVPAVLFVYGSDTVNLSPYNGGHSVIGIGYYWNSYSGNGFIVKDNLNHGISYISQTFVGYFGYIYDSAEAVAIP